MREIDSTVTSKGQVTIPADVRRHLGIREGDKITFVVGDDGAVQVRAARYPTVASLAGAAGSLREPLSWQRTREIAREDHLKAKYPSDDA